MPPVSRRFQDGNAAHSAVIRGVSKLRDAEVGPPVRAAPRALIQPDEWPTQLAITS